MADRETMLKQINEISFTVNDLTLFLDTHPLDDNALKAFSDAMKQRKQLMQTYAEKFEPRTVDCVCPDTNNKSETHTKYPGPVSYTHLPEPVVLRPLPFRNAWSPSRHLPESEGPLWISSVYYPSERHELPPLSALNLQT